MEMLKNNNQKLCSFYVSKWHLVTMLLPYIHRALKEEANVITILEEDIKQNIETLIERLNLKDEREVLKIDWTRCQKIEYLELDKKLHTILKNKQNIILVNGSKNYIDKINAVLDKWLKSHNSQLKYVNIKTVNCYEVTEFNNNIQEIFDSHDKMLNTAGEKDISEVFDGYLKPKEMC